MRYLYLWFLFAFFVMALGFAPDLYGGYGPLDWLRIVHGTLAAGWMALLVAQSWLIGHGHWRLHKAFGRASRYIVPLLVLSSLFVVHDMLGPHAHFSRSLRLSLAWGDLVSLTFFAGLYVCALIYRKSLSLHARFMAATVFMVLPPALGRFYGNWTGGLKAALMPSYWTVGIALLALIAWDASKRRFFWPFPIALIGTLIVALPMFAVPGWPPFVALAEMIGLPPA